jgi:hypothetical protein
LPLQLFMGKIEYVDLADFPYIVLKIYAAN